MAVLFRALLAATMATGFSAPALANDQPVQAPQANWQSGYPAAYQGTWQGQVPQGQVPQVQYPQVQYQMAPMAYGAPVYYSQPVYAQPVYSVPVYNGQAAPPQGYVPAPQAAADADPRYREMVEKCQGVERRGSGTTGAVIGGLVGGVAGNRIASGSRVLGTVAGAAVGAVAGGAIGKSIDKNREKECEAFFSSYAPPQAPAYGYGYPAYGYAPGMTGAPMGYVMVPPGAPQGAAPTGTQNQGPCTETRTVTYEYVPVKRRYISAPPRRPVVRDKRVRVGS